MRGAAILIGSVLAMALAACNADAQEGTAETARRDFQVGQFQSISLTGSPDVIVTVGGAPSVRAEGDRRMVERLDIRVENGDLKIGYREGSNWNSVCARSARQHPVPLAALAAATATESGDLRVARAWRPLRRHRHRNRDSPFTQLRPVSHVPLT